jgi:uncharacterized membrane protein
VVGINTAASPNKTTPENKITFRWTFIVLPAAFLLLSLILAAIFYSRLPADIAYHFQGDLPDRWIARGAFIAWMIIPQVFFTILSLAVVRIVMLTSRYLPEESSPLNNLLPIMGNMMALPQIVLFFAMLQFFLYNAYQIKMIPLWIITLIVMVLGGIVLCILFVRTIRRFRRRQSKSLQE